MAARKRFSVPAKEIDIIRLLVKQGGSGGIGGMDIVRASHGSIKPGTAYVTLNRMKKRGIAQSQIVVAGKKKKKVYGLTANGIKLSEIFNAFEHIMGCKI
jgi:DNA-binding PadR family transcriptional regulator